jgi:Transcriptional regulator, AbiEi antitoxin/Protein of unknown function (DUF559)
VSNSDLVISAVAEHQHGVVSRRQLLDRGISRIAIERRISQGRVRVVHRGVYAFGHAHLTVHGRWMAAVLACGPDAVLSHRAAAALWQLRPSEHLEVIVPTARRRGSLVLHRMQVPADEVTTVRGIPVTTVTRTLFDLAAVIHRRQLEGAFNEAEVRRLVDPLSLPELLKRHPRRRGAAALKEILADGATVTRSELEDRFLAFLDVTDLPAPEVNAHLLIAGAWIECDFVWRAQRLVVELDGRATHGAARAFERDRARDRGLQAHEWRTVRITWRQLHLDRQALAADLARLLALDFVTHP